MVCNVASPVTRATGEVTKIDGHAPVPVCALERLATAWHDHAVTSKPSVALHLLDLARRRHVRDRIDRQYAQPLDVEALARGVFVSARHLNRTAFATVPFEILRATSCVCNSNVESSADRIAMRDAIQLGGEGIFRRGDNHPERSKYMKSAKPDAKEINAGDDASRLIDARIKELGDWRGDMLARVRALIKQAAPAVIEEWKWRGVPVWSHAGIICTGETHKNYVKLTFAKGAALGDTANLFNASLEGNTRRAIDIRETDKLDEKGLMALVRTAAALNTSKAKK